MDPIRLFQHATIDACQMDAEIMAGRVLHGIICLTYDRLRSPLMREQIPFQRINRKDKLDWYNVDSKQLANIYPSSSRTNHPVDSDMVMSNQWRLLRQAYRLSMLLLVTLAISKSWFRLIEIGSCCWCQSGPKVSLFGDDCWRWR